MKKYLIPIICFSAILVFFLTQYVISAPVANVFRSLLPEEDNKFFIGTTSPKTYWANIYTRGLTVSNGTATTTINAGDVISTFAYPFNGLSPTLNSTSTILSFTNGLASTSVLGSFNTGTLTATSGTSFINALSVGSTLGVTGTSTLAGLSAGFGTFSENLVASKLLNVTGVATFAAGITASGGMTLTCTSCITDTNVSDTLTASDLIAGSSVVANAEVDDDLTISGGTVNNSVIGATTAVAGTFTNLVSTASTTFSTTARITAQGTVYFGGSVGLGTSTPTYGLTIGNPNAGAVSASSSPLAPECRFVVTGTFTIDMSQCVNSVVVGVGAVTLGFSNMRPGAAGSITWCNDSTGGRVLTPDNSMLFMSASTFLASSTGLTRTADRCNLIGYKVTNATGTTKAFMIPTDAF